MSHLLMRMEEGGIAPTITGTKVGKFTRWDPEGGNQAYIYRTLFKNRDIQIKQFIQNHQDWEKIYNSSTLRNTFSKPRKQLQ